MDPVHEVELSLPASDSSRVDVAIFMGVLVFMNSLGGVLATEGDLTDLAGEDGTTAGDSLAGTAVPWDWVSTVTVAKIFWLVGPAGLMGLAGSTGLTCLSTGLVGSVAAVLGVSTPLLAARSASSLAFAASIKRIHTYTHSCNH